MTPEELAQIRERAQKATPETWEAPEHQTYVRAEGPIRGVGYLHTTNPIKARNDREFIAHARTDIPALLQYIAQLEKALELACSFIAEWTAPCKETDTTYWLQKAAEELK